jgi:hypothetical protein
LTPSPTAPGVWYQTVSIIPSLLAVDPDTATLAPGSGSDVAISLKAGLAPGVYRFNLAFRSNDAVRPELLVPLQVTVLLSNLGVEAGWNLISVPVRVGNYRAGALFPGAVSHAYSYSGGYTKEDTLRPGAGYWLKFADPQVFDMPGENVPAETVRVAARWNLVGSVTSPVAGNRITSDPPSIMTTGFIGYRAADGYTYADTLKPGSAYWVRVSGGGQLILQGGGYPPGQAPSATKPNIRFPLVTAERATKEELSTLVFTDPKGRKRTLYFGSDQQQSEKELVELPPAPGEAFDVRFRSQRGVELANPLEPGSQEFPIQIQGAELPLSISWEVLPKIGAAVLQITSSDGGTKEYSLKGSGTALLAGGPYKSAKLVINAAGSARIPTSFALRQNFPNPFNPSTEIGFDLPENSDVKIVIYDVLGSEVKTLVDGRWDAGEYRALWTGQADDGRQVASGIYFLRMSAQSSKSDRHFVSTRKMLLAK